jgi:hypothetical protein
LVGSLVTTGVFVLFIGGEGLRVMMVVSSIEDTFPYLLYFIHIYCKSRKKESKEGKPLKSNITPLLIQNALRDGRIE